MSVIIQRVENHSPAEKCGVRSGDVLVSINGQPVNDVLDYRFYMLEKRLSLEIERKGEPLSFTLKKGEYDETGMEFDTYLMDKQRSCKNKCIFCFIDQLPKGMRESLYFKDDDSRLSFLFGNYITLTNITPHEVDRIIKMHISPVNISVHTTNRELRCKMMNNRFAGESLDIMNRFAQAGIKMNCQLVLCKGINDGDELKKSLEDLGGLFPAVSSIAAVPVGLTDYREGLFPLEPYDRQSAKEVLEIINRFGDDFKAKNGTRLAFASDEFYLKSEVPIPDAEFYEDFAQLENGVGMLSLLWDEATFALESREPFEVNRTLSIGCGLASYEMIKKIARQAEERFKGLKINVFAIENRFFGKNITVTGLLTGKDIIEQLSGKDLGEELLLSENMLRSQKDLFLDDATPKNLSEALNIKITFIPSDGEEFIAAILGEKS